MKTDHTTDSSKADVPRLVFFQLVIAGEVLLKRLHRWRMFAAAGWAMALVLAVLMMLMVAGWMEAGCVPNVGEGPSVVGELVDGVLQVKAETP